MKFTTLMTIAGSITATAYAGGSKEVMAPTPPPAPSLGGWFIGGTYGQFETDSDLDLGYDGEYGGPGVVTDPTDGDYDYDSDDANGLDDFEFDMYTLHIGRDLGSQVAGFDVAAYLEVGFLDGESQAYFYSGPNDRTPDLLGVDLDIIPITLNLKLERPLFGPVSFYLTGGIGYAFTDTSVSLGYSSKSENGGGFYAQASAGLLYNINSQFELFAGARWLHLNSLDLGDISVLGASGDLELEDAFAWEVGLRYNF